MRVLGSVAALEPAAVRLPFTTTPPTRHPSSLLEDATVSLVRMIAKEDHECSLLGHRKSSHRSKTRSGLLGRADIRAPYAA